MSEPSSRPRRLFVAGSTGATGRALLRISGGHRAELVAHRRPKAGSDGAGAGEAVFDLSDSAALKEALRGCTTVIQLIGTMRKRFAAGDTYETSDIGTTRQLVEAAKPAGIDHLVLLSSVGAGRPMGAYLHAKATAEQLVEDSGIPYTIFRPSAFIGEGHSVPGVMTSITRLFGMVRYRPIQIDDLARTILYAGLSRGPLDAILEGESLWKQVDTARRAV